MNINKEHLFKNIADSGEKYDVIVAGGGPAGIGAALSAAVNGAEVLILEVRSQFGGTASAALWMCINWLFADNNETDRGGVHRLLVDKIRSMGEAACCPGKRRNTINGGNLDVHPEYLKLALFELFEQFKIDYQLYSPVTGVIKDGNLLKGVEVSGKEGEKRYYAEVIIDATGDGDVACLAGCEMVEGREEDNKHMPISLVFALANVDIDRFFSYWEEYKDTEFKELLDKERDKGKHCLTTWYSMDRTTVPGVVSVNNGGSGYLNLDGAKTADLTAAERVGIQIAMDFVSFVKENNIPGMEDCYLVRTGAFAAVRDTRRLVGEYVLTEEDILHGKEFEDVVARKYGAMDAVGFDSGRKIKQGAAYPYRSLLPKDVDGLLAAGRCGSATFLGHSGGKSMGNMLAIGQAAGAAAHLAVKHNITPRELEAKKVQQVLRDMGVSI
ncbi:MAG: FAD-dependent oxidoreductase [Halanaerobiaceae bacterium]